MDIREFLEDHIDLVDQNNFTELYSRCVSRDRGRLTDVLHECGINPLDYMTEIPSAYAYMADIRSITIPAWIDRIGDIAFFYCDKLTSIIIPDSVTKIGERAFYSCYRLTSVTIGNSVTSIGDSAFRDCTGLTSITIPDSVTSIGLSAFEDCSKLTSVTIPDSVTSIGEWAFDGCTKLVQIIYNGTLAQWREIQRTDTSDIQDVKIQCIDGVINA